MKQSEWSGRFNQSCVAIETETPGQKILIEWGDVVRSMQGVSLGATVAWDVLAAPWLCAMLVIYLLVGKKEVGCAPDCSSQVGYAKKCSRQL